MSKYEDLFNRLDQDGSGAITKNELGEALSELGITVPESKIDEFFQKVDINGDGKISKPEFEAFVNAHHPDNAEIMEVLNGLNHALPGLKRMSTLTQQSTVDRDVGPA